jgi:hypothetical protein
MIGILIAWGAAWAAAQGEQPMWKPGRDTVRLPLPLFRSGQAFNLPTTETLQKRNLEFEISHRFFPPVHEGDALYGLDGPVVMRIGLNCALTDRFLLGTAVSNAANAYDFKLKYKLLEIRGKGVPVGVGLQGGVGWNTAVYGRTKGYSRNVQAYGQVIVNTLLGKRLGIGLVPSILTNGDVADSSTSERSLAVGGYLRCEVTRGFGLMGEWSPVVNGYRRGHNPAALGIEVNTGGHFFKVLLTNSTWLNPSQYLAGSDYRFQGDELRLGFNITRLFQI